MSVKDLQEFLNNSDLPRAGNVMIPETTMMEDIVGTGRSVAQGVLLGWADELEAKARQYLNNEDYDEAVREIRREIKAFEDNNPGVAITSEILGAVAPTVLMMLNPTGSTQPMAIANTTRVMSKVPKMFKGFGRKAAVSSGEGAIYTVGKGEKGIEEDLSLAPGGAAWGLGGTIAVDTLFKAGRGAFNIVINRIREKMGDKVSRAAEKELIRLQKESGLTIAEIVAGVQSGQLMVENQTLQTALRGLFGQSGEAKQVFTDLAKIRERETRNVLEEKMVDQLTPGGKKENLVEYFNKSSGEIKKEAKEEYEEIFKKDNFEVPEDLRDDILNVLQIKPDLANDLVSAYRTDPQKGLVPFFKYLDDGSVELVRVPTIKDAEIIRRRLNENIQSLYKDGKGDIAENLKTFEQRLRTKIDTYAPTLGSARMKWSNLQSVNEAYNKGLTALGKKTEELSAIMNGLKQAKPTIENQNILNAYRNGVMISLKDKLKSPGYAGKVSDPTTREHNQIRAVFDDDRVEDVLKQAEITNESIAVRQSITGKGGSGAGSQTQQNLKEQIERSATGLSQGQDPLTTVASRIIRPVLDKIMPGIDDRSIRQVMQVLYEKNPEKVRQVLTGRTDMGELQDLINMNMDSISRVLSPSIAVPTSDTEIGRITQDQLNLLPVQ